MVYDFASIEPKWQARWAEAGVFKVEADPSRPKFYNVCMYPYPSGDMHMGHIRNYTYGDLITRYRMMQGDNVLSPFGWDSFGLPAENAAIETGVHPRTFTDRQIGRMREQLKRLGAGYDWRREVAVHKPDYYRWDQWLFLQLFKKGLAYKKMAAVNWCPNDQTVLANEQVVDGFCERCGAVVEKRDLEQWFFKITDYAERLVNDLSLLDRWPDRVRVMQENWIGRSEGCQFRMKVAGREDEFEVFTTRPDTVFGMTFAVLAPEHELVESLIAGGPNEVEARRYVEAARRQSEIERLAEGDKSGVFTGAYAVNPVNGKEVPIYIADYVLVTYGTGAIMAVPGQDQRDWDFAERYGLEIIPTVERPTDFEGKAYTGDGLAINSEFLDGLDMASAKKRIISWFEERGLGQSKVAYRLRDWLISRQRYWGCPIPIIKCPVHGLVPVPEEDLPVVHPDVEEYAPKGESPLAAVENFVNVVCPIGGEPAERETDTMDTFVDSSWYFLRYCDPSNENEIFDPEKANYWMPIDQYIGGVEHAVLHLMYARFITKFFYDQGMVNVEEPFAGLFTQGMITLGTGKMSKSKGNVIAPDDFFDRYGADALRLFHLFIGPPTDEVVWNDRGVEGTYRFLDRVWRLGQGAIGTQHQGPPTSQDLEVLAEAHRALKKVTEDIDRFRFNTCVAALMGLTNKIADRLRSEEGLSGQVFGQVYKLLLLMLAPMAPHIAAELWEQSGHRSMLALEAWPDFDRALVAEKSVTMIVQVNGKVRDRIEVPAEISPDEAEALALASSKVQSFVAGGTIAKIVTRPPNLVNIVVG